MPFDDPYCRIPIYWHTFYPGYTAASKPNLTEQGYRHFFRVNARNDAHGWNVALFIKNYLKVKKVAILNEKVAYSENLSKETIAGLEKLGITDIMQETIVGGAKDYSAVLTKVKAYDPDVIFFIATTAPDNAIGVRQTKDLGIDAIFFGSEGARDKKDYIQAAEGAADGSYVYHFGPDIYAIPAAADYVRRCIRECDEDGGRYLLGGWRTLDLFRQRRLRRRHVDLRDRRL